MAAAKAADPTRSRRLTVGPGAESDVAGSASTDLTSGDIDKKLAAIEKSYEVWWAKTFESGNSTLIRSTLDLEKARKVDFGEKDLEARSAGGTDVVKNQAKLRELVADGPSGPQIVAYKCHKGKKADSPNQDSFSIYCSEKECALYCVFDGHGPNGHDVSQISSDSLVKNFLWRHKGNGESVEEAFKMSFLNTQEKLKQLTKASDGGSTGVDCNLSGSTCTMAYHDWRSNMITVAHVGDSRAVLGSRKKGNWEIEDLTVDHKPNLPGEKSRIEAAGGRVVFDGYYNHRVFSKMGMYPGLNMSRALGDTLGHSEAGLSCEPDFREINVAEMKKECDQLVLLLCTDGVWEFIESPESVKMFVDKDGNPPKNADALEKKLTELTRESFDRWMKDSDNEISDDITGIAVVL